MSTIASPAAGAPRAAGGARARWGLQSLNFFMADMQAGIGPFLGVFLQQHGWTSGPIGSVMTAGGVAGMLMTVPAGAFIDHTTKKRWVVIVTGISTVLASFLILLSQTALVVTVSQVATAIAGAAIGPAVSGMTLGIARQKGFNAQNGRNQAWNHAGNMIGAGLSGWLGWRFGMPAIFALAAVFGVLAIASVMVIPESSIDHRAARGLEGQSGDASDGAGHAEGFRALLRNRPMLILAAALAAFHLGNGAMLPLYGMAVVGANKGDASIFVAETVVVAQAVMIVASLLAMKMASARGYWLVMLISFAALPLRGFLAGSFIEHWGVWPVQALDGIGAGLQSVAVPGLVACLLSGTGRVNVGQGAVMTVQGLGASLSPAIGGWLAQLLGYHAAFFILGSFAFVSLALWIGFATTLRPGLLRHQGRLCRSIGMTRTISWVHVGDLHMDEADGWQSRDRLERIVAEINDRIGDAADFVILPGDNAIHATPGPDRAITDALAPGPCRSARPGAARLHAAYPGDLAVDDVTVARTLADARVASSTATMCPALAAALGVRLLIG